jgi:hypothetical protein
MESIFSDLRTWNVWKWLKGGEAKRRVLLIVSCKAGQLNCRLHEVEMDYLVARYKL